MPRRLASCTEQVGYMASFVDCFCLMISVYLGENKSDYCSHHIFHMSNETHQVAVNKLYRIYQNATR